MLLNDFDLGQDGVFVGGHLTRLGALADIEESLSYTNAVLDGALTALQTVDFGAIAATSGVFDPTNIRFGNQWLLFDEYFKALVKVCSKAVVEEFGCKLAGVDVTIESTCRTAQSFWRIDF